MCYMAFLYVNKFATTEWIFFNMYKQCRLNSACRLTWKKSKDKGVSKFNSLSFEYLHGHQHFQLQKANWKCAVYRKTLKLSKDKGVPPTPFRLQILSVFHFQCWVGNLGRKNQQDTQRSFSFKQVQKDFLGFKCFYFFAGLAHLAHRAGTSGWHIGKLWSQDKYVCKNEINYVNGGITRVLHQDVYIRVYIRPHTDISHRAWLMLHAHTQTLVSELDHFCVFNLRADLEPGNRPPL